MNRVSGGPQLRDTIFLVVRELGVEKGLCLADRWVHVD